MLISGLGPLKRHIRTVTTQNIVPLLRRHFGRSSVAISCSYPLRPLLALTRLINGIQLTSHQLLEVSTSIRNKAPCNLLVFGVGNDSQYWIRRNSGGRTVFLEDREDWLNKVSIQVPSIEAYSVSYDTCKKDWQAWLNAPGNLELMLPQEIAKLRWDVILVDGPAGYRDDEPGRMKSIYSASLWAKDGCDVYVHDCDRPVERTYTDRFLGPAIMQKEVGILRHYRMPGGSR